VALTASLIITLAFIPTCVHAANVKTQLCLVIDGSGSISSNEWNLIKQAIAKAINETIPHEGSVELAIIQFVYSTGEGYAKTELKPTVIDNTNYNSTAAQVLTMPKANGNTPTAHGLYLGWSELKNSPNFAGGTKKVINIATDGVPNVRNGNATADLDGSGGSPDANDDVVATVNVAVSEGLNELDVEAIGITELNSNWLRNYVVRPQPGIEAPPFIKQGWIRIVADPAEFANTIGQKIGVIIYGNDDAWAPSAEGALAAGLVTVGLTSAVSAIASAVSNPSSTIAKKFADLLPEILKKWLHEFISSKRKLPISKKAGNPLKLTKLEIISYIVALVILTLAFAYAKAQTVDAILSVLPIVLATSIVVGFVKSFLEEAIARKLGVWTEHRLWYFGLASFVLSTLAFRVPFSSPSRNIYYSREFTKRSLGLASAASVFIGLAFAAIFYIMFISGFTLIGSIGMVMSLTIAFFETLPIPPMNGKEIYNWSKTLWFALFVAAFTPYILCILLI
ncbi:VWA domain-containing protein, partial [Candidatus Bathyarchaeota archaeon]|nr:VWA domain-containing protein [Candidatus Bathyarchaeota archaeon]